MFGLSRESKLRLFLGLVLAQGLSAEVWTLDQGPRWTQVIPPPVISASGGWEVRYTAGVSEITVWLLKDPSYYLEAGKPLDCSGVSGQTKTLDNFEIVYLDTGFIFLFPQGFTGKCEFLNGFTRRWNYLAEVLYNRGRLFFPEKLEL